MGASSSSSRETKSNPNLSKVNAPTPSRDLPSPLRRQSSLRESSSALKNDQSVVTLSKGDRPTKVKIGAKAADLFAKLQLRLSTSKT